jgi:hypothetical protein
VASRLEPLARWVTREEVESQWRNWTLLPMCVTEQVNHKSSLPPSIFLPTRETPAHCHRSSSGDNLYSQKAERYILSPNPFYRTVVIHTTVCTYIISFLSFFLSFFFFFAVLGLELRALQLLSKCYTTCAMSHYPHPHT